MMRAYKFPYISLNPGATYRGLHDSLVNYGKNEMPIITCCHEEVAIQIAHGYAKTTGKPMVAIVHDVVGLLTLAWQFYYAYLDRVPVISWALPDRWTPPAGVPESIGTIPPIFRAMPSEIMSNGMTSPTTQPASPNPLRAPTA